MKSGGRWIRRQARTDSPTRPASALDGANKDTGIFLRSEDDSDLDLGGVPIVDVMSLDAGTHTIGLQCSEVLPDDSDIVIHDIGISVVELGFD